MGSREQVKEITAQLEQGVKELFNSETYANYLSVMSRFHNYSTRNTLLIHLQMPNATKVAGFSAWKNKFKRQVKKGERSIKIFAPMPFVVKEQLEKLDPVTQQPIIGEDGNPIMEEYIKFQSARFKVVSVFDVSQTEGEPLPTLAQNLTGNVEQYNAFMDALRSVSPLPIVFEDLPSNTDGFCRFGEKISIREGMSEIQTVCAAIHEMAHAKLHDRTLLVTDDDKAKPKDKRTEEVEAESVAYAVCQYFGIETGANSFGYLATWSKGRELKELNASLDTIRKTASELIDAIDGRFQELVNERNIVLSMSEEPILMSEEESLNDPTVFEQETQGVDKPAIESDTKPDTPNYIAEYMRIANDSKYAVGENVLMPPVFIDGNFNRTNKRIRVKVEEPAGKYQIFSREEHGETALYFLTASGCIDRISEYFRSVWDEQQRKWVQYRPTEAEMDAIIPQIAAQFESDLANPEKWAQYQHAAVVNRFDECEKHNVPVRIAREAQRQAEARERVEREREEHKVHIEAFNNSVDELAETLVKNEKAIIETDPYFDKKPIFALFEKYGVDLPIATKGWVNRNLQAVQVESESRVAVWIKKGAKISQPFCQSIQKLIAEIAAQRVAAQETDDKDKEEKNKMSDTEHRLYSDFAEQFPQIMSRQFGYIQLESDGFEPLSIEWIDDNHISIMQTYVMNGDLMYDPMMIFDVDSQKKTMTPHEYQLSMPPLYQRVNEDGSGQSIDGNGREWHIKDLRAQLFDFSAEWLGNIAQQGHTPVHGNMIIDGEYTRIHFDSEGKPILPEPPKMSVEPTERNLYEKFADMFPEFMNREYSTIQLESEQAKPLVLEWVFGDTLSIAHKYELEGKPAFEPMVMLSVNSEDKTMTAQSFDLTVPPQHDIVKTGDEPPNVAMQQRLNDFTMQWLERAEKQRFVPVRATLWNDGGINDTDITVTFDSEGKPILPEPQAEETTPVLDMSLPDPSIGLPEMNQYGYSDGDTMLPLRQGRAVELYDADHAIYLLYTDDTEAMAFDRDEILKHDGLCGIERIDWENSPIYAEQMALAAMDEKKNETAFLNGNGNSFAIYQIKNDIEAARDLRFVSMSGLEALGLSVDRANYNLVYTAPFSDRVEFLTDRYPVLNKLYEQFNVNHPPDYTGRSLSVGDVVVLKCNGDFSAHFVDSTGFVELDGFLAADIPSPVVASDSQLGNTPTLAELEAEVKAGNSVSLMDVFKAAKAEKECQSEASRKEPTLKERLEAAKEKAASQNHADIPKTTGREVG